MTQPDSFRYLSLETLPGDVLAVTLDDPSGRANRTTDLFKAELGRLLDRLETGPRPAGVLFRSAKASFGTGGDIGEVMGYAARGPEASAADSRALKMLFRRIERLDLPTAAVIEGTAAGGGWELALACRLRICAPDPAIRLGLPEVGFGLVPGGGGLQRLPHLVGGTRAGEMIAGGRLLSPVQMQADGLIDALVADPAERIATACAMMRGCDPRQPWDRPGHRPPDLLRAALPADARPGAGAPLLALDAIARIVTQSFDAGAETESLAFAEAACSAEARALVGLNFLDRNALRRRSGAEAEITALAGALCGQDDMAAAALRLIAAGRVPSAAVLNAASVRAGAPEVEGGILRALAACGAISADLHAALQNADIPTQASTGTDR
ncbi:enoyl-CoA hydratase-related protein [Frigidibacter sp. MR17.14]|uniref:enoyl-CoA hydratase-related protein n=1 Tax=Frigidibacter sp. MR17.14 TaxID=3126509 RepID=UPI003012FAA5